ncbi:uncharacterized protein F4817DRAFT_328117 [Daldinia loculata]|uniref:uncharacterized protein n=1 Tax=Daldinia loculata TaxID=103429 RepID=UPI0020C4C8D5|nr:uncharacterized protein F4817DRAFT_328117 [Daldinia loculata]KAI1650559.1 hypothetical protein F4817DRAFT_328117 [Daldinia loculata]
MGFLGVYKALYDYAPQSEGELSISEGDILYVLEKSADDDWWKAKKKASADDEDEPVGLVPNNYVEEAPPVGQARALYEYTRQTDEELSFPEDAPLQVYDTSDPDWILVGFEKDYGFAPANYIEMGAASSASAPATTQKAAPEPEPEIEPEPEPEPLPVPKPPSLPTRASVSFAPVESEEPQSPPLPDRIPPARAPARAPAAPTAPPGPAATLAGVMQGKRSTRAATPPPVTIPPRQQYLSEESDGEPSPALPVRPRPQPSIPNEQRRASAHPQRSSSRREYEDEVYPPQSSRIAPGGFHLYNINEMVSIMGKKKKMPTTLGVNLKTGVILIAPEHVSDGPSQEWTAEKMTHYSREGKHVFLELVRPSKSIDFHAGAKDTAEEIVSALGELAGAVRAEGLREVIMAGTGQSAQKKGQVLYDFEAQGDDEVTVSIGDEVMILDDTKSEEWWQVRRLKSGKEGVVPSSYIEIIGTMTSSSTSTSGINAGKSTVAQNRLEEARLTKEALKRDQKAAEVGPGMILPERRSSLSVRDNGNTSGQQRNRRENGRSESSRSGSSSKPKPDPTKVRSWTDRSKSFSVEAQFLGLKDGKINLHKLNGVKIAVPVAKMSIEDIEYVERITGASLDEDKPLSEVKRALPSKNSSNRESASSKVGASVEPAKPDYDWFQFFLSCDVAVGLCERYAQAFAKDSMDESVLPDVDASVLRNLGLREGDIIKVTRYLDKKYGRDGKKKGVSFSGDDDDGSGGLFSGPGGTLRNNTRKGRPAPAVQTNDNIDAKAFSQQKDSGAQESESSSPAAARPKATGKSSGGFDDDAWDVKPAKQQPEPEAKPAPTAEPAPAAPVQPQRPPTQSMQDLSLLSTPLEPIKVQPTATSPTITLPPPQAQPQPQVQPPQTQPQQPGATPAFFTGIPPQQTGLPQALAQPLNLGLGNRQRPTPPQVTGAQGALMPPPPSRPLSAPQSVQPSGFAPPPLQPQMTGIAPPGQSLNDLTQQRMQQQYMGSFQPQPTGQGMMPFNTGVGMPAQSAFGPGQFMQPQMTGAPQIQSPFADPRPQQFSPMQNQPTGFPGGFQPQQQFPQQTGVNSYLPPALEPQRTGMPSLQPQQTGFGGFGQGFNPGLNNAAAQPQQPPAAPLLPQQTGPPPPVRFGVTDKIVPQPTGRRANLAQATPQNPFGF